MNVMFRRMRYYVRVKTTEVWSERLQRKVRVRASVERTEIRERYPLHIFFKRGDDSMGTRWKSQCGRTCHSFLVEEIEATACDLEIWIRSFLENQDGKCAVCWNWLQKHKDEVLTAERLAEGDR